jgi:hypothetical protein
MLARRRVHCRDLVALAGSQLPAACVSSACYKLLRNAHFHCLIDFIMSWPRFIISCFPIRALLSSGLWCTDVKHNLNRKKQFYPMIIIRIAYVIHYSGCPIVTPRPGSGRDFGGGDRRRHPLQSFRRRERRRLCSRTFVNCPCVASCQTH